MPRLWIVVCPEPRVQGGVWNRWLAAGCVAVGWPPPTYMFDGPTDAQGWRNARARLREMQPGDKVIPFLLQWRIGPVGTITEVRASDEQWSPTVGPGEYADADYATDTELGRRIQVRWDVEGMPPPGRVAAVPAGERAGGPLAFSAVKELSPQKYQQLLRTLATENCWVDIGPTADPPLPIATEASPSDQSLSLLERDLQKVLARNLSVIEPGLAAAPGSQLEEYQTDVGRIDLLCRDALGKWVVVELKAGSAGDDAVGQIAGYMAWVRENVPGAEEVRGVLVCRNASDRVKAAIRMVPGLMLKKYEMSFTVSPL